MSIYKKNLFFFKDEEKTYDICKEAVRIYWGHIAYVPLRHMTEELCFIALDQCITAFHYISECVKTEQFCINAIKKNEMIMTSVPYSMYFRYSNFLRVYRKWRGYNYHFVIEPFDIRMRHFILVYRYIKIVVFIKN